MKKILFAAAILLGLCLESRAGTGLPVQTVPFETCVSTVINPTALTVATVPMSVIYSTSSTGSPTQTLNNYKWVEIQNQGTSDIYVGFTAAVSTFSGAHDVTVSSATWALNIMENARLWLIPQTAGGRAAITLCR